MGIREEFDELTRMFAEARVPFRIKPPANDRLLDDLESVVGFAVTGGLRQLWQTCANGTDSWTTFFGVFTDEATPCRLLSVSESVKEWTNLQAFTDEYEQDFPRDVRIKGGWTNARWLPFAEFNGCSTCVMYDRDPGVGGVDGQVIAYQHDPDAIYLLAPDFDTFFKMSNALLREHAAFLRT